LEVATEEVPQFETPSVVPPTGWRFPISRNGLVALAGLGLLALIPVFWPHKPFPYFVGAYALVYAMIGLSVTVVTGYAGLISLMPYSFAGIGALTTGVAMGSWGWPFWLCIPLAAACTVPISIIAGAISVRLKGLYLAIATLAIASMLGETFFTWHTVTNGTEGWATNRPSAFSSDGLFYLLCFVAALLMVWMIEGLRTSRLGRAMLALRDNEREAQALGINVSKTKLVAFVISGMMAGVGGAFLAVLLTTVGGLGTTVFQSPSTDATSIALIVLVVVGGIDRAWGAFFGAIIFVVQQQIFAGSQFFGAFVGIYSGALLIVFLLFRPGGLLQVAKQDYYALIKRRPVLGIAVVTGVVALNVGLASLIVKLH
jgi:branched-chain amino acid transport system permease protein